MRWYLAILVMLNAVVANAATTSPTTAAVDANALLDQRDFPGATRALVDAVPTADSLRAAARLITWYDSATDRSVLTKGDTAAIAAVRARLVRHPDFAQAYRSMLNEPKPPATQPVAVVPPAVAAPPPVVNYYYNVTVVDPGYRNDYDERYIWWPVVAPARPHVAPRFLLRKDSRPDERR
jgi:hypothetical protein